MHGTTVEIKEKFLREGKFGNRIICWPVRMYPILLLWRYFSVLHISSQRQCSVTSVSLNVSSTAQLHATRNSVNCLPACFAKFAFGIVICLRPRFMILPFSLALNYVPKLTHISQPEISNSCCPPLFFYQRP